MNDESIGRRTRSQISISESEHRTSLDLGSRQPYLNMKGGVGIPGSRTSVGVSKFKELDFPNMGTEITAIMEGSKQARSMKSIQEKRQLAKHINRRIVYEKDQVGIHSLHIGNDIAAVYNSKRRQHTVVYDYGGLARGLDRRLAEGFDLGVEKGKDTLSRRRQDVAEGMREIVRGDIKTGVGWMKHAGLDESGRKWAYKMTTLMLAEHARGLHAIPSTDVKRKTQVYESLGHVGKHSFRDVFASSKTKKLAPFAMRGGAKTFRS